MTSNKNLEGIKRFRFFKAEPSQKLKDGEGLGFTLNDMIPISFKIYENYFYILGKLKKEDEKNNTKLFRIFKMHQSGKILEQYIPFSDCIIDFSIMKSNIEKSYLVTIGTDLRNQEENKSIATAEIKENNSHNNKIIITPSPDTIPSIKFFDLTNLEYDDNNNLKHKYIIYLLHKKDKITDFYKGDDLSSLTELYNNPIKNISHFNTSSTMNSIAFSIENNLIEVVLQLSKKDKAKFLIIESPDKQSITNIKYCDNCIYFSTASCTFYKEICEEKGKDLIKIVGNENLHSGAMVQNFDINNEKNIILSTPNNFLIEEYNFDKNLKIFEKNIIKVFERKTRFMQFYKDNYIFVLYEDEKKPALCVYSAKNNIFLLLDESFYNKDILDIINDNERIYILYNDGKKNDIKILKEMNDKEKFDIFYSKQFYDIAYNYGQYLNYDKRQLAEIAKAHAEYLYKKGDYVKCLEQYILTINYLDPTYVIDKFIEGSKKDYLVDYLEALQTNAEKNSKFNQKRFNDFTALLLNIYIRKKQFEKIKKFISKKNVKDVNTISIAIDVCKDTNNIDLALYIAETTKMEESYVDILMNIKNDVNKSLEYINKMTDIEKKFEVILHYGEKLLEAKQKINDIMIVVNKLIDDIIKIKKKKNKEDDKRLAKLNYEKIINIFTSEDTLNLLEKLLEHIMKEDPDCPKQIILKRVELYVDSYADNKSEENKNYCVEKIKEIINNETFKEKLDKNYLLMLFKISGCIEGEAELNKYMDLNQDLMQLYMEKHDYQKINELCETAMNQNSENNTKKINYWLEALNYYIKISEKKNYKNLDTIGEYMTKILENLSKSKETELSPMFLLGILQKAGVDKKIIKMKFIREFFKNWVKKKKNTLFEEKKEVEENFKKIKEFEEKFKKNKYVSKSFSSNNKCSNCGSTLDEPYYFFRCGHGYHQSCLDEVIECNTCKEKFNNILEKIEEGKKIAKDNKIIKEMNNTDNEQKYDVFANYFGKSVFVKNNEIIKNKEE